jgi:hypothetical protein
LDDFGFPEGPAEAGAAVAPFSFRTRTIESFLRKMFGFAIFWVRWPYDLSTLTSRHGKKKVEFSLSLSSGYTGTGIQDE